MTQTSEPKHMNCFVVTSRYYNELHIDIWDTHINIIDVIDGDKFRIDIEYVKDFIEQITGLHQTQDALLEWYNFGKDIEFSLTPCALQLNDYSEGVSVIIDRYKIDEFCCKIRDFIG